MERIIERSGQPFSPSSIQNRDEIRNRSKKSREKNRLFVERKKKLAERRGIVGGGGLFGDGRVGVSLRINATTNHPPRTIANNDGTKANKKVDKVLIALKLSDENMLGASLPEGDHEEDKEEDEDLPGSFSEDPNTLANENDESDVEGNDKGEEMPGSPAARFFRRGFSRRNRRNNK